MAVFAILEAQGVYPSSWQVIREVGKLAGPGLAPVRSVWRVSGGNLHAAAPDIWAKHLMPRHLMPEGPPRAASRVNCRPLLTAALGLLPEFGAAWEPLCEFQVPSPVLGMLPGPALQLALLLRTLTPGERSSDGSSHQGPVRRNKGALSSQQTCQHSSLALAPREPLRALASLPSRSGWPPNTMEARPRCV